MFRLLQQLIETPPGAAIWGMLVIPFIVFDDVPDELIDLPKHPEGRKKIGKKLSRKIYAWVVCSWLFFTLVIVLSVFYFLSQSTVFIVSANVEKLSISPYGDQRYPEWKFTRAILHPDCDEDTIEVTGLLTLEKNTYI